MLLTATAVEANEPDYSITISQGDFLETRYRFDNNILQAHTPTGNNRDADRNRVRISKISEPEHGEITAFRGWGGFDYRADADFVGTVTFEYKITVRGNVSQHTANIVVLPRDVPTNRDPVFLSTEYATSLPEGHTGTVLTVHADDPDGDPVTYSGSAGPFEIKEGGKTIEYKEHRSATPGTHTITVTADDSRGGIAQTAVIITVDGTNEPPIFDEAEYHFLINEGHEGNFDSVSATDPELDSLKFELDGTSDLFAVDEDGTVRTIADAAVTPGTYTLTVTVDDGQGNLVEKNVEITVNAHPKFEQTQYETTISQSHTGAISDLILTAVDGDGDLPTFEGSTSEFEIGPDGVISVIEGAELEPRAYTFYPLVRDGRGGEGTTEVKITVEDNSPEFASEIISYTFWETDDGSDVDKELPVQDADHTRSELRFEAVSVPAPFMLTEDGILTLNVTDQFPLVGAAGDYDFNVTVEDPDEQTDQATVKIIIKQSLATGDTIANDDAAVVYQAANPTPQTEYIIDVLGNDEDTRPNPSTLYIVNFSQPSNGTVEQSSAGLTYTPNIGFTGQDTFVYRATTGNLNYYSNYATVTIEVKENTAPFIVDTRLPEVRIESTEIGYVLRNLVYATDIEDLDFSFSGDAPFSITENIFDGTGTQLHTQSATVTVTGELEVGDYEFQVSVTDGEHTETATITVPVVPGSHAPQFIDEDYTLALPYGGPGRNTKIATLAYEESDGDDVTVDHNATFGNIGRLTEWRSFFRIESDAYDKEVDVYWMGASGTYSDFSGGTITIDASDINGDDSITLTVLFTGAPNAPVFDPTHIGIRSGWDNGDSLGEISVSDPDHSFSQLTLDAPGSFVTIEGTTLRATDIDGLRAAIQASPTSTIEGTVTATDPDGNSTVGTVTYSIDDSPNEAPVFDEDPFDFEIERTTTGATGHFITAMDIDYDVLEFSGGNGYFEISTDGQLLVKTFAPASPYPYTFQATVTDNENDPVPITVNVQVMYDNQAPEFLLDEYEFVAPIDVTGDYVAGYLTAYNPDHDELEFSGGSGNVQVRDDGAVIVRFSGSTKTFTATVKDGRNLPNGNPAQDTVQVTVNRRSNVPPQFDQSVYHATQNSDGSYTVMGTVTDPDDNLEGDPTYEDSNGNFVNLSLTASGDRSSKSFTLTFDVAPTTNDGIHRILLKANDYQLFQSHHPQTPPQVIREDSQAYVLVEVGNDVPEFTKDPYQIYVTSNVSNGDVIGWVSADDNDNRPTELTISSYEDPDADPDAHSVWDYVSVTDTDDGQAKLIVTDAVALLEAIEDSGDLRAEGLLEVTDGVSTNEGINHATVHVFKRDNPTHVQELVTQYIRDWESAARSRTNGIALHFDDFVDDHAATVQANLDEVAQTNQNEIDLFFAFSSFNPEPISAGVTETLLTGLQIGSSAAAQARTNANTSFATSMGNLVGRVKGDTLTHITRIRDTEDSAWSTAFATINASTDDPTEQAEQYLDYLTELQGRLPIQEGDAPTPTHSELLSTLISGSP